MARQRRAPPLSTPNADRPSPSGGSPEAPASEPPPDDALRRAQHDEILRLQRKVEDEIMGILHDLTLDRARWS